MAKKDLKEATKAATAGMFTVNSDNKSKLLSDSHIETIKENENNTASDKEKKHTVQKVKKTKPANDYLYLDLRPNGEPDLKSYVMEQAHKLSMEQGKNISATNYIQNLIKKDMDNEKKDTLRTKIINILENVSDEKLDVIYTILLNLI